MKARRGQAGFTIVELLVVIVVIAILATITMVTYNGVQGRAHAAAVASDLRNVADQLLIDEARTGTFPATLGDDGSNGVAINPDTHLNYTVNNAASPRTFCITGVNSGAVYKVTENSAPTEGFCTGDEDFVAANGGSGGTGGTGDEGGSGDGGDGGETPPVLNPALVAAYGFNETSGTSFANQVPGGTPATLWTGAQITTGHTGNAVVGTSNRQAAVIQGSPGLASQGWTGMTISYWQYRTNSNGYAPITMYTNASRGGTDWGGIWYDGTTDFGGWLYTTPDNWPEINATGSMPVNQWQYVTFTWSGSGSTNKMKFYLDGVLKKTVTASGAAIVRNAAVVDIGGNDDYTNKYTVGRIDDLRIYNTALSDAEIVTDMNTPVP